MSSEHTKDGRRTRGPEITRVEGLSDPIFAFSATLLVVSLEVPRTFPELTANLRGFFAFALSFAMLIFIWACHNGFFRRYALQDTWTVVLNAVLLFVVLFYVYPLKFLAVAFVSAFVPMASGGHGDHGEHARAGPALSTMDELANLFIIYGLGFLAVFLCLALLYRRAYALRESLELSAFERKEAIFFCRHYLVFVLAALISVGLAKFRVGLRFGAPGFVYALLGPLCHLNAKLSKPTA